MRRLRLSDVPVRDMTAHGSEGLKLGALGPQGAEAGLAVASLAMHGRIGAHPAIGEKVLIVLRGGVECTGGDGERMRIGSGSAVLFTPGEVHSTEALLDSLLLIIEGDLAVDGD